MCLSLSQKVIRVFRMHRNVLNTRETFIVYVSFHTTAFTVESDLHAHSWFTLYMYFVVF